METIHIDDDVHQKIDDRLAVLDDLTEQYELTGDSRIKSMMVDVASEINALLLKQKYNGQTRIGATKTNTSSNENRIEEQCR